MFSFLDKLRIVLAYGPELETILVKQRSDARAEKRKKERHRLNLCYKHQQESKGSYFAEHNCDYCKSLQGGRRLFDKKVGETNEA